MSVHVIHNMVQENGKSIKENNMEIPHNIPINSLVKLPDSRVLYVIDHTRDCDGTPLYTIYQHPREQYDKDVRNVNNILEFMAQIQAKRPDIFISVEYGYSEESLNVIDKPILKVGDVITLQSYDDLVKKFGETTYEMAQTPNGWLKDFHKIFYGKEIKIEKIYRNEFGYTYGWEIDYKAYIVGIDEIKTVNGKDISRG